MLFQLCLFLIEIAILIPFVHLAPARTETVRIRAALYIDGDLHLFNNQSEVLILHKDRKPFKTDASTLFQLPEDYKVTAAAAVQTFFNREYCFFGEGNEFFTLVRNKLIANQYRSHIPRFLWCGIDAAVSDGKNIYYFKGCKYMRQDHEGQWDDDPKSVSDIRLPCYVDAAWNDGENVLVLKGDQVWTLGRDIKDPKPFDDYFQQNVWKLAQNTDGLFNKTERYPIMITKGNTVIYRTRIMSPAREDCEIDDQKDEESTSDEDEKGDGEDEGKPEEAETDTPSEKNRRTRRKRKLMTANNI